MKNLDFVHFLPNKNLCFVHILPNKNLGFVILYYICIR
jgi:hypothetical protein